jgi:hypothetical protein
MDFPECDYFVSGDDMTYSSAMPERSAPGYASRPDTVAFVVFLLAAFAFQLRFNVSPEVMNMFVGYTGESGPFYQKLHFGTDAIFLLLPLALFSRPFRLERSEAGLFKAVFIYMLLLVAFIAYLFVTGRAGSSGFVIDTYLVAGAAGLIALTLPPPMRRMLGDITVVMLIVSAVIGIIEAVTHHRIMPYDRVELVFRPVGLTVHPLALGALCATAIGFAALTRWPLWVRLLAVLVLFIGCAASGARTALLLTCAEIFILLIFTRWPRLSRRYQRQAKFGVIAVTIPLGATLLAVMFAAGLMNRFGNTLFDENFMARVTIYKVFGYASWSQLIFGMPVNDLMNIVNNKVHLPFIESTPVVISMLFGLPMALFFVGLAVWIFARLLRGAPLAAWIGTITFIIAALSNNTLSSKTPEIAMLFVLLIAYRSRPGSNPAATRVTERSQASLSAT